MRRVTPISAALGLLLVGTALGPAPVAAAGPATPSAAPAPSWAPPLVTGSPASIPTTDSTTTLGRMSVSTLESNARVTRVLRTRTRSGVLGTRFTMTVWDTATGSYVYKRRSRKSLRGASTTKLLTAVGVLHALGPDHRFRTTVRAGASPDEVVLVAGGDPLLSSASLRRLARRTARALGYPNPTAGTTATPEVDPDPAPVDPEPSTERTIVVRADDSLFGGATRSRGWRDSYLPDEVRPVGAFARDDNRALDPTEDAGRYFTEALRARGVDASYGGRARVDDQAPTLAAIRGHTLAAAVSRMLLHSDNDTAEMLFRHIAHGRHLPATFRGARAALRGVLAELGVPSMGVRIVDGSGLSLRGRVTAPALTAALTLALSADHPQLAGIRGWLPIAGRTGTLRAAYKRFHAAPARCAAGLVQGKTGTLADAISLAGYATGADGRTKVYVSIVNRRPTRYTRLQTRWAVDRAVSSITGCW